MCDWYMCWAALHSTPGGSIKSYSCCKSDMFLLKPSNSWMWLLYNVYRRFMFPRKVIRCKNNKAVFTTQLFMISFLCGGELMSGLHHLHHYFLIIYAMLLPRMIHAGHNRRTPWLYTTFWAACAVEWVRISRSASNGEQLLCFKRKCVLQAKPVEHPYYFTACGIHLLSSQWEKNNAL